MQDNSDLTIPYDAYDLVECKNLWDPEAPVCLNCINIRECYDVQQCRSCDAVSVDNAFTKTYNGLCMCDKCYEMYME